MKICEANVLPAVLVLGLIPSAHVGLILQFCTDVGWLWAKTSINGQICNVTGTDAGWNNGNISARSSWWRIKGWAYLQWQSVCIYVELARRVWFLPLGRLMLVAVCWGCLVWCCSSVWFPAQSRTSNTCGNQRSFSWWESVAKLRWWAWVNSTYCTDPKPHSKCAGGCFFGALVLV